METLVDVLWYGNVCDGNTVFYGGKIGNGYGTGTLKMTKRNGEFGQTNNKKLKLNEDIEALWGDDIDANDWDDCINLASQVYQQEKITCTQLNNVTLLPTYSAFKDRSTLLSSTQLSHANNNGGNPSTSKNEYVSKRMPIGRGLENELNTLQQKYNEKEGEVSILRAQLQETKTSTQIEQQKLQSEWKQKLMQAERQMKSVKSELEFKNLEIANLKQKILEITKHNIAEASISFMQNNTINIKQENTVDNVKSKSIILQPVVDPIYPLKKMILDQLFNIPKREQHITETKVTQTCRNAVPYLQNRLLPANVIVDKSDFNIDCIYSDMLGLMQCTKEELSEEKNLFRVNKVVCACEQFMYDLQNFLEQIKINLRTEDVLEADSSYLKCLDCSLESINEGKDEIGVKLSIVLNFLAQLLPYSEYLKKYVCRNESLIFQEKESIRKQFSYQAIKERVNKPCNFLNMVLDIVQTAGAIRKVKFMSNFLNSAINLLINIHKSRNYDYVSDIFCKLTKEIVLSRPRVQVICQITFLFKVASQHSSFVEFLLNKSQNSVTSKKGVLYFNKDACRFYIFVMLFDNSIFGPQIEYFSLHVGLNLLCFMYNTFKTCHWIHHRDVKECECIVQLYKLEIEIVFRALEKYIIENTKEKRLSSEWSHFFKHPITTKVLKLMIFNSYELTEKYITVFSQYKQIEQRLLEEEDVVELEKLNITDEIIELSNEAFTIVDF